MSVRDNYDAELRREGEASGADGRRDAVERLRAFTERLIAEGLPDTSLEIEFHDEELLIDPGRIMITVRVNPDASLRMFYEEKRPDKYVEIDVPGVATTQDLEREIGRLLVAYR
jgi:hypothetical protein